MEHRKSRKDGKRPHIPTAIRKEKLDVAERTICAQLAAILQPSFDCHAVHAEYNRHGVESKAIKLPDADGVLTLSLVSPDIIVHQPGHDRENLLVAEVKKTTNTSSDRADLEKLKLIKGQLSYRYAFIVPICLVHKTVSRPES